MPDLPPLSAQVALYQILDDLRGRPCPPPGAAGRIHLLLDRMRYEGAPTEEIALIEELSLALHRERIGLDDDCAFGAAIGRIADAWLDRQIPGSAAADLPQRDHPWLAHTKS